MTFKRIIIMGRRNSRQVPETIMELYQLLETHNYPVAIEEKTASLLNQGNITVVARDQLKQQGDLLVVVGGDGSLIKAAHIALECQLPILGVNRGHTGFMTDIYPDQLTAILSILQGDYLQESRLLLKAQIKQGDNVLVERVALNEAILVAQSMPKLVNFELSINQQPVSTQRADGLIAATPTGSTAYAMSGGGPILHPKLDAMVLVPIMPHKLSSRPIVIGADANLRIAPSNDSQQKLCLSIDGQTRIDVPSGSHIEISQHSERLQLIHPKDYNYYHTLREKLGWEKHAQHNS